MSLARALRTQDAFNVILVTNRIPEARVRQVGFQRAATLLEAFDGVDAVFSSPEVHIIPSGGVILPVLQAA